MPTVKLTRAGVVEAEIELKEQDLRLGRGSDNDVVLKDPDKTLSRHHAELRREGDRWFYLDLNSANGSWIGDRRITRQDLTPGVAIVLGDYQLQLSDVAAFGGGANDADKTYVIRPDADTQRVPAAVVAAARAPRDASLVGGAVSSAAPKPAAAASQSSPVFRRIIIYGSIAVFGAFAIMLALLLRPDPDAPVEEATPAADSRPAPLPPADATTSNPPAEPPATPAPPPMPPPAVPPAPTPAPATAATPPPAAAAPAAPGAVAARPAPRPRTPADTDPDATALPARAGETRAALQQRRDGIRKRYAQGLQQLAAGQFAEAKDTLTGVSKDAPQFRDLAARLSEADAGMRRQSGDRFKAAAQLEQAEDWSGALKAYEGLKPYAAALPTLSESIERTRQRMHAAGADALTRARQFDSRGRVPEAIALYQRAIGWLPADHPGLEAARQRLAQLMGHP